MRRFAFVMVILGLVLGGGGARAADTIETYDAGAVDVEFYFGTDGQALGPYEKTLYASASVGYGLIDRLSGYMALGIETNESLGDGAGGFSFGLIGTPVDTAHFDLDLFVDVGVGGAGLADATATPGFEVNVDLLPDQGIWGVYFRLEDTLAARDDSREDDPATPDVDESRTKFTLTRETGHTFGTCVTIQERHQLFLEHYMNAASHPERGQPKMDGSAFALGYNVAVHDALELVTHADFHVPYDDHDFAWGLMVGLIATVAK
jgi:hypothetical protein